MTNNFRILLNRVKKGFTLSETVIIIAVIAVIATLTIPNILGKRQETINRTKLKKAVSIYERFISTATVENRINTDAKLLTWAGANCENSSKYFTKAKFVKNANGSTNHCKFKNSDSVWWDISNPSKVIVAFKERDLTSQMADSNENKAFYLIAWFENGGVLRLNDVNAAEDDNKNFLVKLYNYIYGRVFAPTPVIAQPECDLYCRYRRGDFSQFCSAGSTTNCSACKYQTGLQGYLCDIYDENSNRTVKSWICNSEYANCKNVNTYENDGMTLKTVKNGCDFNGENCFYDIKMCEGESRESCAVCTGGNGGSCKVYDKNGKENLILSDCKSTLAYYDNCISKTVINDTSRVSYDSCNVNTNICSYIYQYSHDGTTIISKKWNGCDVNGNFCRYISNYLDGDINKPLSFKEFSYNTSNDGTKTLKSYIEHIYSYETGVKKEIYTNKECNTQGVCGWQDTLNSQGKRTIKKFNYNSKTGEYTYYHENIYDTNGTTIIGTRECYSENNCYKCSKAGC